MLERRHNKPRKTQENENDNELLTSPLPTTRHLSNASVMGELVCCFCHEIDVETNLCAAGAYYAKRAKNGVKHVLSLTKKWIDVAKVVNNNVLLWKRSWRCACSCCMFMRLLSKHAYRLSKGNTIRLCESLNGQHMMVTMIRIGSR